MTQTTMLRLSDVKRRTGLSRTAIYARMGEHTFPQSVPLGPRTTGWVDTEVEQWIQQRIVESRAKPESL